MKPISKPMKKQKIGLKEAVLLSIFLMAPLVLLVGRQGMPKFPAEFIYEYDSKGQVCG